MKVVIIAFGTRGDIQPFVAFGLGLQAAGHTVKVATHASYCEFVESYGLKPHPIPLNLRAAWQDQKSAGVHLPSLYRLARDIAFETLEATWEACQDADALVFNYLGRIPGIHIAEKLRVPAVLGLIHPHQMDFFYRARYFNDVGEPVFDVKEFVLDRAMQIIYMPFVNRWRKKTLGLPNAPLIGNDRKFLARRIPALCSWNDRVYPGRPEWPDWFHVTGYWFLDTPSSWQPPKNLLKFLVEGPPPVYIGFSSVTHLEREDMTNLIIESLEKSGQRGIITSGWSELGKQATLPESVYVAESVPHDWLFPQVSVAVHHGGVGTTGAALRAGIPSVVIPFVVDEPFWAWQINQLSAGPPGIPPQQLTVDNLASALQTALNDAEMRQNATTLGEHIRAEDGVARSVELFHHYLSHHEGGTQ